MRIYAPVKDFNGVRNNVRFVKGVGETNDPSLVEWFKGHGYTVEGTEKAVSDEAQLSRFLETEPVVESPEKPDFDKMTPNELRDWMKANGYGNVIKNIRNKEKLLELINK